jgi:hypothetical protein
VSVFTITQPKADNSAQGNITVAAAHPWARVTARLLRRSRFTLFAEGDRAPCCAHRLMNDPVMWGSVFCEGCGTLYAGTARLTRRAAVYALDEARRDLWAARQANVAIATVLARMDYPDNDTLLASPQSDHDTCAREPGRELHPRQIPPVRRSFLARHTLSRIFLPWKEIARLRRELATARNATTKVVEAAHRYYTDRAASPESTEPRQ